MDKLLTKLIKTIRKFDLINLGDRVLLGLSGGFDSTCLLYLLAESRRIFKIELFAVHINHNLRSNAVEDYEYAKKITQELRVPIFYESVDLRKYAYQNRLSIETAGRNLRYQIFSEISSKHNISKIATAHNSNDNVESIIIHMIRGSGMGGLCGILPKQNFFEDFNNKTINKPTLIRPLIEIPRAEVEEYCEAKSLNPRLDESNLTDDYFRNEIRNHIMPTIISKNGLNPINRLSEIIREENRLLEEIVTREFEGYIMIENNIVNIDRKKITSLDKSIIRRLIYRCTNFLDIKNMSLIHVDSVVDMCFKNYGDKQITLPNSGIAHLKNGILKMYKGIKPHTANL